MVRNMEHDVQCLDKNNIYAYIREVNYYETDMMKVVHHSNYIRWFEEARSSLLDYIGYSYAKIEEQGIMIPVLSVSCDYKMPCRFGEKVCILTRLTYYNGVRMKLFYEVWNESRTELRVTGTSAHCFVDADFKPISIKRKLPDMHEIYMRTLHEDVTDTIKDTGKA